jgi:hypothetical protein
LPDWRYFPFHPSAGIQTSSLISESLVGRAIALTTQCFGSISGGDLGRAGSTNGPSGTAVDAVTVA